MRACFGNWEGKFNSTLQPDSVTPPHSKEFNSAQRAKLRPLAFAIGPWGALGVSCLIRVSLIMVGALSHMISVHLLKELAPKAAMWTLNHGTPIKTLDAEAQWSFLGWQYSIYIITHLCWKGNTIHDAGRRRQKAPHLDLS